ncbi:pre-RNA processing PIH1/Nop17-domain-containing protein [Cunninghamella echinulata]|nr:pre-RNA processing PIH1/Nop17-domain-containing protein [Cunninghamella echinulata]
MASQLANDPTALKKAANYFDNLKETTITIQPQSGYVCKTNIIDQKNKNYSTNTIVYINICHSQKIPEPPLASEKEIQATIMGTLEQPQYHIPISIGQPRKPTDNNNKKILIFDACIHTQPYLRSERDLDFRLYILELAFELIEEQCEIELSRDFTMPPNIHVKDGPIPKRIIPISSSSPITNTKEQKHIENENKKKIEEITPSNNNILKKTIGSWSCQPIFEKEDKDTVLKIILHMPSQDSSNWQIDLGESHILLKGVIDKVIDIALPTNVNIQSSNNRIDFYKRNQYLVICLDINNTTIRKQYL